MRLLSSITNNTTGLATSFGYDASNSGELTQVTFPYGGHMRWQYGATSYAQGALRGVQNRYLLWDNGIGERSFSVATALSGDSSATANTVMADAHANATKKWIFDTAQDATQGLVTIYQESRTSDGKLLHQLNYTWSQDLAGRNYIGRTQDILDPGQSYMATKQTDQNIDSYGNVTQSKLYAYGNLSSPAKTYNNTYVTDTNYTSLHMYNRLLTSTVTDGNGNTLTLVSNTYDRGTVTDAPGALWLDTPTSDPSFMYRGNVTSSTSFGHTVDTQYDVTGTVVYTDDGNANHGVTVYQQQRRKLRGSGGHDNRKRADHEHDLDQRAGAGKPNGTERRYGFGGLRLGGPPVYDDVAVRRNHHLHLQQHRATSRGNGQRPLDADVFGRTGAHGPRSRRATRTPRRRMWIRYTIPAAVRR